MAKKKMKTEETSPARATPSPSLKDLGADNRGPCSAGKQAYEYDRLRARKRSEPGASEDRIWFDDLPPHTD